MATLFDTLMSNQSAEPAANQQRQIENTLLTKRGKALAPTSSPMSSSLASNVATAQVGAANAQQTLNEAATAANLSSAAKAQSDNFGTANRQIKANEALAGAALATQAQQQAEGTAAQRNLSLQTLRANEAIETRDIAAKAAQKLKELTTNRNITINELLADKERSDRELEYRKDAAELEQIGFLMAMQDRAYLDELQRIGQMRQLGDETRWAQERNSILLGAEFESLLDDLNFRKTFNADRREFERLLAEIDLDTALKISNAAIAQANSEAVFTGATETVKAGADWWAKKNPDVFSSKKAPSGSTSPIGSTGNYTPANPTLEEKFPWSKT